MDLVENGQQSEFASYFDIDWGADPLQRSRILLPFLGDTYGKVLESQQLSLHYDDQGFFVRYYQMRFPVGPESYAQIISACLDDNAENGIGGNGYLWRHRALPQRLRPRASSQSGRGLGGTTNCAWRNDPGDGGATLWLAKNWW